jgi:hypothetical protein
VSGFLTGQAEGAGVRRRVVVLGAALLAVGVALSMTAWLSSEPMPYVAEFAPGRDAPAGQRFVLSPAFDPRGPSSFASSVAWVNDGEYLAIVAYGSGSCPNGPHNISVVGDQKLEVRVGPLFPDRDVCTADLGPHVTVVEIPEGITPTKPLVARFEDREVTLSAVGGN